MKKKLQLILLLIFIVTSVKAQVELKGKVTDADTNQPIPGVSIKIVGSDRGTVTDLEGTYTLSIEEEASLSFSFIGYKTQTVDVNGQSTINIQLEEDIETLDEVVVVGYGAIKKSDLTGSISSIEADEMIKAPAADPMQSLQGKVAGLQVLNGSGRPGAESNVRLRGITTLNDNRVLYVVDGVIIEGGIGFLNSNDIESVEVLKDASSKAIYGTRGANGVILVTTKTAEVGEGGISLSSEYGVENIANKIGVMSGPEFANYINDAEPGTYNNISALPNTDWQDEVLQNWQPIQTHTISAKGATEKLSYYISGGYFGQEGIVPKSDFERMTFKLNTSYEVKPFLTLGTNLTGININATNPPGVVNSLIRAWPINAPYNDDGTFGEVQGSNPLAAVEFNNSTRNELRALGNFYAEVYFLESFQFRSSYQFDIINNKNRSFTPEFFVAPLQQNEESNINIGFGESRNWIFENTLSYNKELGRSTINSVIGYTAQEINSEFISGGRRNLIGVDPSLWYLNAGASDYQVNANGGATSALTSILFRTNYAYDGRYLATLTFRRDGSSKFGRNNRYANFPAIALGWNISNENFYPQDFIINNLKLRASYGLNGNQNIPGDDQYSRIGSGINSVFGFNESLINGASFVDSPGNPNLRWETTSEYDIGIEFDVLESRLQGEFDYYNRTTSDILVLLDLPGYAGAGAFVQQRFNAATVNNNGIEFALNWVDEIGDFTYGFGVNGFTNNNEVTDLGEDIGIADNIISGDLGNGQRVTFTEVGMPIGHFYGYKVAGIFQNDEQLNEFPRLSQQGVGDFIYEDVNGDGVLNDDDKTFIGSWIPDFVYGFNFSVGFKGLNISADFAGQSGNSIYNGKQAVRPNLVNFEDRFLDRWTGEGTSNTDPQASLTGINYQPSDYFVEDASFFKLRTLTVNYQFLRTLLDNINFNSISVFVRGTNLFIWTDYSGYTPEIGSGNSALGGVIDNGVYPTTRVLSTGLNMTF
ncbi:TonB-dependent receptor [Marivirga sp.]|uniref:SusC/RagA family TonB-linked outer membrane protein n=1 Tax=Marivirga sp. TaxID=2018662 RepID=UPI002D80A51A|nr:TonB-dependent receptor [Marivirga sp.]HET8859550.1 TonB-dependent receptor [Marivirga sp.]